MDLLQGYGSDEDSTTSDHETTESPVKTQASTCQRADRRYLKAAPVIPAGRRMPTTTSTGTTTTLATIPSGNGNSSATGTSHGRGICGQGLINGGEFRGDDIHVDGSDGLRGQQL